MKNEWIPTTERLPEVSGQYLVCLEWQRMRVLDYSAKHKVFNVLDKDSAKNAKKYAIECIAWMPLPEPYSNL